VDLQQKLNGQIPLDLVFKDETGKALPLRSYFGDKPVLLSLVYFKCPNVCPMSMQETTRSLSHLPLKPGTDYNVLIVSFDPQDTPAIAAEQKAKYARQFRRAGFGEGFHFLTGSQEAISKLTDAVGWKYVWDEQTKQFAHAAGIMVATPDGKLSRYFYGLAYAPQDIRMALVEASHYKIAGPADYILLFCYRYDEAQGKYTLAIMNILRLASALTVILLAGMIFYFIRNETKEQSKMNWKRVSHVG
jgi:protein SCO1/2